MAEEKGGMTRSTSPEVIEADIARTRRELSGTVSEIQERLSPSHIRDEAKEKIREATVDKWKDAASRFGNAAKEQGDRLKEAASRFSGAAKERGSEMVDTFKSSRTWDSIKNSTAWDAIKSNPVPVILIGAGVAWLIFNRNRPSNAMSETMSSLSGKAGELTDTAQARVSELTSQAKQTGSELASKASQSASEMAEKASQSASRLSQTAQERARMASNRLSDYIRDNPLGVALAVLGIGAVVGLSIPESRKEQEVMGSASDALLSRAKETAQRALQKAQHAAEKAVETAGQELNKEAA